MTEPDPDLPPITPEPKPPGSTGYRPLPGTFGLSQIGGTVGALVAAGQLVAGDPSPFTHAFVVLDDETVIEAMPGGARIVPLEDRLDWRPIAWSWMIPLIDVERQAISDAARQLEGVPYSFLDYISLGLLHTGVRRSYVLKRVKSSGHMICSQLVDATYLRGGVHLFDDGRWSGDVMPGSLANLMLHPRWYRQLSVD